MNTVVVKQNSKQVITPFATIMKGKKKKSFEEACTACNAVPLDTFIDELKASIKEYFDHA